MSRARTRETSPGSAWTPFLLFAAFLAATAIVPGAASYAQTMARTVESLESSNAAPASRFLRSLGVNTHFQFSDTVYAQRYAEIRDKLVELGVTRIRDALNDRVTDLARHGITTTAQLDPSAGTPEQLQHRVAELNLRSRVVDAIEGPNEPDQFWPQLKLSYQGRGYPDGTAAFQERLYTVFKADPATRDLPIIGPAFGPAARPGWEPASSLRGLGRVADFGNMHPYPYNGNSAGPEMAYGGLASFWRQGTFPSVTLDTSPNGRDLYASIYGNRSFVCTETGYPTDRNHTSPALAAKYIPRLFAEYWRLGIEQTYLYEFADWRPDPDGTDPEQSFGLLRADLSETPAYRTLRRLIAILKPGRERVAAASGRLRLMVEGNGEFSDASRAHHILLRRADGALLLLLWDEVSGEDASTQHHRPIAVQPLPAMLETDPPARIVVHDLESKDVVAASVGAVRFAIPDAVIILEITATVQHLEAR